MANRKLRRLHVSADSAQMNIINSLKDMRAKRKAREAETGNISLNGPDPKLNGVSLSDLQIPDFSLSDYDSALEAEDIPCRDEKQDSEEYIPISEYQRVNSLLAGYEDIIAKSEKEKADISAFFESQLSSLVSAETSEYENKIFEYRRQAELADDRCHEAEQEIIGLKNDIGRLRKQLNDTALSLEIANSRIRDLEAAKPVQSAVKPPAPPPPPKPESKPQPKPQLKPQPKPVSRQVKSYPFGVPTFKGGYGQGANGYSGWN